MLIFVEIFFLAAASSGSNRDTTQQETLFTHLLLIYLFISTVWYLARARVGVVVGQYDDTACCGVRLLILGNTSITIYYNVLVLGYRINVSCLLLVAAPPARLLNIKIQCKYISSFDLSWYTWTMYNAVSFVSYNVWCV